jgi:hypothetical protein
MLASTVKLRPRYFLIVLALAGDSTITRLVVPRATGALPDERVERAGAFEVVAFLLAAVDLDVDLVAVVDLVVDLVVPVGFLVVAIIISVVPSSVRVPFQLQG